MARAHYISKSKLTRLLAQASPEGDGVVWIQTSTTLAVGRNPLQPTKVIDIANEQIRDWDATTQTDEVRVDLVIEDPAIALRQSRRSGRYLLEVKGKLTECGSLKDVLAEGLRALERHQSGTLEHLSAIRPRSKRIVARDPKHLFDNQDLARRYAEKLTDGWWFGTNNSAGETLSWLRRACDLAGLKWDKDFVVTV